MLLVEVNATLNQSQHPTKYNGIYAGAIAGDQRPSLNFIAGTYLPFSKPIARYCFGLSGGGIGLAGSVFGVWAGVVVSVFGVWLTVMIFLGFGVWSEVGVSGFGGWSEVLLVMVKAGFTDS